MKRISYTLLALALIVVAGCKKDRKPDAPSQPDKPTTTTWVTYNTTSSALPADQINAIAIAKDDVVWAGTSKGLTRISGDNFATFTAANSFLPSSFIQALAVQNTGTVWIGTDKGLAKYTNGQWTIYTTANSLLPENGILSLHRDDAQGITWAGTSKGLVRIDDSGTWQLHDELADELILSMATDKDGALWLGTFNHFSFNGRIRKLQNGKWTTYKLDDKGYTSTFPYAVTVNAQNEVIAVLTGTSVRSVIKISNGEFTELPRPDAAYGFRSVALEGDKIWVGGTKLYKLGPSPSVISIPASSSNILTIAIDSKGRKWLGTQYSGLVVYRDR